MTGEKEEKKEKKILAHGWADGPTEGSTEVFADLKDVAPFLQSNSVATKANVCDGTC